MSARENEILAFRRFEDNKFKNMMIWFDGGFYGHKKILKTLREFKRAFFENCHPAVLLIHQFPWKYIQWKRINNSKFSRYFKALKDKRTIKKELKLLFEAQMKTWIQAQLTLFCTKLTFSDNQSRICLKILTNSASFFSNHDFTGWRAVLGDLKRRDLSNFLEVIRKSKTSSGIFLFKYFLC